ncbi:four-carbon acid sugar kinase family protein [Nonomuraea sp. 3N208]|uniref:four-carbon acid sugar kinase family protein n=1 Tax=Nonomuraea sp. 3N208 TaxID=3457421 RepID=UPI003FCDE953
MGRTAVFALADDLSGAAETAAVLMTCERPARIALSGPPYAPAPVLVADLDTRHHPRAGEVVWEALRHTGDRRVFVKIDSLLRGAVAATLAACASVPVVLAPALPSAGRTVVGGIPYMYGTPLRETRAWHAEPRPAPVSVAKVLGGLPSVLVPLAVVRVGGESLAAALSEAADAGQVAVCDAETDADLDAIVTATLEGDPRTRLVGAGGLAAALGRALEPAGRPAARPARTCACDASPGTGALLVVVGTAEPAAAAQARLLAEHGAQAVTLDAAGLDGAAAARVREALTAGPTVVTVTVECPAPSTLTAAPSTLTTDLADLVRRALDGGTKPADLVLTGGETARRVLEALDVRELTPVGQVHHGAVHSRTPQGASVVTRPGSFGGRDSLLRIAAHLRPHLFPSTERLT